MMKQIKNKISKAEIATLPKVLFPGRIFVIYTEADADKAISYLQTQRIVGVDTETRPSFKRSRLATDRSYPKISSNGFHSILRFTSVTYYRKSCNKGTFDITYFKYF